ncbi:hypothetical protein NQ315_010913 [Exocentrus adspersus]|uniref:Lipase domain-containing protein n=1 Tax=Exocentrus adspersus TaxID=1586481 RepID=A0AAV8VPU0_9CUCU|nr:hypothetical protein NQ315_010913 [Exocentrus adspersus]
MKVLLFVISAVFGAVLSGPALQYGATLEEDGEHMEYFLVETSPGVYAVEDLVNAEANTRAEEDDLTYHFFSRGDSNRGVVVKTSNIEVLENTGFSPKKDTLFIIHGWMLNHEAELNDYVRDAIFSKHDINIFVVDWSPVAARNYISAKGAVTKVGEHIGNFVRALASRYGLRISDVSLAGHSLGAHIAGGAGAALNGEVDHIVGLDPAGPLFSTWNTRERLDPTDAKFVQVIHTNGGLLGFRGPLGHADYYPNGGSSQPGCGVDIIGGCAHGRSYVYYAEAIRSGSNQFVSNKCLNYGNYISGLCRFNPKSAMGGYNVDKSARGDYFLDTNDNAPFAKAQDDGDGKLLGFLDKLNPEPKVEESSIVYWYFNKEDPLDGVAVNLTTLSVLSNTSFSVSKESIFIIYGWENNNTSPFATTMEKAIIKNLDVNGFLVDWSKIADQDYIPAKNSVSQVGHYVGKFISGLVTSYKLSLSLTTIIGHSLGGQVAGNAGAALDGKLSLIIGLDPALPLFAGSDLKHRLDPTDAQFVQVIHTNGGLKGFLSPVGHSDYYPNGGSRQPGCGLDLLGSCAHERAFRYYAESLGSGKFVAVSCGSYSEFSQGLCKSGNVSVMGGRHVDRRASGRYFLDTNSEPPYAKGTSRRN